MLNDSAYVNILGDFAFKQNRIHIYDRNEGISCVLHVIQGQKGYAESHVIYISGQSLLYSYYHRYIALWSHWKWFWLDSETHLNIYNSFISIPVSSTWYGSHRATRSFESKNIYITKQIINYSIFVIFLFKFWPSQQTNKQQKMSPNAHTHSYV